VSEVDELVSEAVGLELAHINRDADDELSVHRVMRWWALMIELYELDRDNWYVQAHWDMPTYRRMRGELIP
jgi:hypothetical protein